MAGAVYPPLFGEYVEFCKCMLDYPNLDKYESDDRLHYPTALLPSLEFLHGIYTSGKLKLQKAGFLKDYILWFSEKENSEVREDAVRSDRFNDSYADCIYQFFKSQGLENNTQPIKYVISELIANIAEHSRCNRSVFAIRANKRLNCIEAAFFDNGITIPGSFADAGIKRKSGECIREAVTGTSTKPEAGRGHGLPSTTKILKEMNCDILIVSGQAAFYLNGTNKYLEEDTLYELDEPSKLNGTLVSFQMYLPTKKVDIYRPGYL